VRLGVVLTCFGDVISWGFGVVAGHRVVLGSLGVVGWDSIRSLLAIQYLGGVVLGNRGVVLDLFVDVTRGRVKLQGLGVVAGSIIRCGVILWCLGGLVTGNCVCCVVRRRRCGSVSAIPRRHEYTRSTQSSTVATRSP
jgi:hypothetical protein